MAVIIGVVLLIAGISSLATKQTEFSEPGQTNGVISEVLPAQTTGQHVVYPYQVQYADAQNQAYSFNTTSSVPIRLGETILVRVRAGQSE